MFSLKPVMNEIIVSFIVLLTFFELNVVSGISSMKCNGGGITTDLS